MEDVDVDDSINIERLRLEDAQSPSSYSSVCSEENVTNSCACVIEFPGSLEEYSTATVPNNSNQVMQNSVLTKNNEQKIMIKQVNTVLESRYMPLWISSST